MLFKFFSYDKATKTWQDSKCYCSICMQSLEDGTIDKVKIALHQVLTQCKLISIDLANFSYSDVSTKNKRILDLFRSDGRKRFDLGKLMQLPYGEDIGKKVSFWSPYPSISDWAVPTRSIRFADIRPIGHAVDNNEAPRDPGTVAGGRQRSLSDLFQPYPYIAEVPTRRPWTLDNVQPLTDAYVQDRAQEAARQEAIPAPVAPTTSQMTELLREAARVLVQNRLPDWAQPQPAIPDVMPEEVAQITNAPEAIQPQHGRDGEPAPQIELFEEEGPIVINPRVAQTLNMRYGYENDYQGYDADYDNGYDPF